MKVKDEYIKPLWTSITRMPYLSMLTIISYAKEEVLNLEMLHTLPNLDYLYLKGKLQGGVLPPIFASLTELQDLRMGWSRMQTDPMPSFSHMLNLVQLHLYRVYEGQMMTFRGGRFPKLKKLYLADMEQLSAIEMEAGTMQTINYVKLIGLRSMLAVPSGFQYLPSLQEMVLLDMPEEFMERLRGQDSVYIQLIVRSCCT
uniref:NB-ARC domain-containing protein n=1 Tax=Oryza punctata TaxID=4537 RepID=A0A0E0LZ33_ORYPU